MQAAFFEILKVTSMWRVIWKSGIAPELSALPNLALNDNDLDKANQSDFRLF